ncbi:MAG: hypothetical protein JWM57_3216 [Phycisphaerales bacterium]|nr:hypothetical protein [Phycisphaerales bacterium]
MMSIRESLAKHQKAVAIISAIMVVGIAALLALQLKSAFGSLPADGYFYSVDDGKTYFRMPEAQVTPFDFNGKAAVRAFVATQGDGVTKVFYLERLRPDARAVAVKLYAKQPTTDAEMEILSRGPECKLPGETAWRSFADGTAKMAWILTLKGDDGKVPVYPS